MDDICFAPGPAGLAGAEITRGWGFCKATTPWDDCELTRLAHEICERERGKPAPSEYMLGIATVQLFEYGLEGALKNVGYENLDGAAIKEVFDGMKNVDIGQLVTYSFADHEGDREGPDDIRLLKWDEAKGYPVQVTDWFPIFSFPELYGATK
jgi:hypothetical protein